MQATDKGWYLQDRKGNKVGRLARAKQEGPDELRELYTLLESADVDCVEARIYAILARRREDQEEEWQARCKSERWEVVLPELVFAPKG